VIRLVNSLIFDAVLARASDIHIQPNEVDLKVRFRIDGVLFDQFEIPKASQEEVLSRIKIIGEMNIAEKRLPQDGRASVQVGDRMIDLRIASLPTSFGERIVIRLLDKSARLYTLEELGMPERLLKQFRSKIHLEHGLILVTGPTGGGKSTTLYAGLQEINTNYSNIVTLEDPIEYQLSGISQTQISEKKGLTFADGLRSVLRQDPDVIMVGEIRDQETANMAIQSALTGHMVFSTLHTNDAPSAITRLLDLGVEPYLVASSVVGVLAQRLVRKICPDCKKPDPQASTLMKELGTFRSEANMPYSGAGCENCRSTGYQGRIGIFEFMEINDHLRSLIQRQCNAAEIRTEARSKGMKLLREDGLEKILAGSTTVDEVVRVSMQAEHHAR
jgi:general secretion pathway protein E